MFGRPGLEGSSRSVNEEQAHYGILTVHDSPPMLDKATQNFENLRPGGPSLILTESV